MNNDIITNNQVTISGEIVSDFNYSHELYGEKMYIVDVEVQRTSGNSDIIPVMVSERLVDVNYCCKGLLVNVSGQFRSYNRHDENKNKLILSVFARELDYIEELEESSENQIFLDGYICKEPIYRKTPLGREICDLLIAVNRQYGKTDYIPCICWGRNARYANKLNTGVRCVVSGRIQSRKYLKKIDEEHSEERTAYEVSVSKLEVITDEK